MSTTDNQDDDAGQEVGATDTAADMAALASEAAAFEDAPDAKAAEVQAKQEADTTATIAAELADVLGMGRMMCGPLLAWWPDYEQVWSDGQIRAISQAGAVVMVRHGWDMGEMVSQWGPYLALVAAAGMPAMATYTAIKAHKAEAQRAARIVGPAPAAPMMPQAVAQHAPAQQGERVV